MSTKYEIDGEVIMMTKGALDVILDRTTHIHTEQSVRPIIKEDKEAILATNLMFSENGLRVLAFAYKSANILKK